MEDVSKGNFLRFGFLFCINFAGERSREDQNRGERGGDVRETPVRRWASEQLIRI